MMNRENIKDRFELLAKQAYQPKPQEQGDPANGESFFHFVNKLKGMHQQDDNSWRDSVIEESLRTLPSIIEGSQFILQRALHAIEIATQGDVKKSVTASKTLINLYKSTESAAVYRSLCKIASGNEQLEKEILTSCKLPENQRPILTPQKITI